MSPSHPAVEVIAKRATDDGPPARLGQATTRRPLNSLAPSAGRARALDSRAMSRPTRLPLRDRLCLGFFLPKFPGFFPYPGPLAQWVEQRTFNPLVQGSSPWRPTRQAGQKPHRRQENGPLASSVPETYRIEWLLTDGSLARPPRWRQACAPCGARPSPWRRPGTCATGHPCVTTTGAGTVQAAGLDLVEGRDCAGPSRSPERRTKVPRLVWRSPEAAQVEARSGESRSTRRWCFLTRGGRHEPVREASGLFLSGVTAKIAQDKHTRSKAATGPLCAANRTLPHGRDRAGPLPCVPHGECRGCANNQARPSTGSEGRRRPLPACLARRLVEPVASDVADAAGDDEAIPRPST